MLAETKTKDGNKGVIVCADKVEEIMDTTAEWIKDGGIAPEDLADSDLMRGGEKVGKICFSGTCPVAYST